MNIITDNKFLGITLDAELIPLKDQFYIFQSEKFINMAKNLGPSYLRMGGTAADMIEFILDKFNNTFDQKSLDYEKQIQIEYIKNNDITCNSINFDECNDKQTTNFNNLSTSIPLHQKLWDMINNFIIALGPQWEFIFGLNAMIRKENGKLWDPTNALKLLKYSQSQNYHFHLELGNEPGEYPNVFKTWITPEDLANDFKTLRTLIMQNDNLTNSSSNSNNQTYKPVMIIGPDLDRINNTRDSQSYLIRFLDRLAQIEPIKNKSSILDRVSWHHYYISGPKAKAEQFIDPDILDTLKPKIVSVNQVVKDGPLPDLQVWLGEGSSAWSSGAPNITDRYIAGFMFLDKIGLCALNNVKVFIRQDLYYGHYSLIGLDLKPNPDYWIAVLFNQLVGAKVIPLQFLDIYRHNFESGGFDAYNQDAPKSNAVRIYAHCSKQDPGGIVFYAMNLNDREITISFNRQMIFENYGQLNKTDRLSTAIYLGSELHQYLLTPGLTSSTSDVKDLLSRVSSLNGKTLRISRKGFLPTLKPKIIKNDVKTRVNLDIILSAYSYGFFVYPLANIEYCL
ncbi:unnamed protein product [Gordionus sp. m RMFG-2023]|uniref:heparanase-like n=1 Tax=Gordionus sp. m RMFG-2023 TaxID=3053472 RepID=UPI0030DF3574